MQIFSQIYTFNAAHFLYERLTRFRPVGFREASFAVRFAQEKDGTEAGIRTQDPLLRRQMLYPTELLPHRSY